MSQNINYQRLITVREANKFQRNFAPVIAQIMSTAPTEVADGVKCCGTKKHTRTKAVLAPSELKVIQTDYDRHLDFENKREENEVRQLKVAAIATLAESQDNIIISSPETVVKMVQHIMEAETSQEVKQKTRSAFKEIKKQHTKVFVSNVATAVKESAMAIGFKDISLQEPKVGMIRIIATNEVGQNLLAEIETNKQVDIHTELVGYTDGRCAKVIRSFDEEMLKRGICTEQKKIHPTHGIPVLPYAKKLLKQRFFNSRHFVDEDITTQESNTNQIFNKR